MKVPAVVQEIIDNPRPYLVPADVGKVLNINPDTVRAQARAGMIEFPVMISGSRVRFPKIPFLRWLVYEM